ncbi:SLC13 family permease [Natranaerofaba carboxydovora]|uniref:SLC13 family permease n=1 Tax=Natranaerofaba carboxydovora TaxID=2742683 RepID=UPI001F13E237|nr:SLC13 family permease [Natranaerofaba carboxydovora]UMZ72951.1 Citrate transporter [Natranaerofaba carboxydovora]
MLWAQLVMALTLILMISGKTPLYITAIVGATVSGIVAGFPITGDEGTTIVSMVNDGLNPVIADMAGVLLFIGIMEKAGFLDAIIKKIIYVGRKLGGGPGVCTAGGIAAGVIGALTGFTQPAITASVTGPAATKLGVDANKVAGVQAHAGHLGNFGGFTHPTQVAVIATAGIGFGMINLIGTLTALSVFAISYLRLKREEVSKRIELSKEKIDEIAASLEDSEVDSFGKAIFPFIVLVVGFAMGYPVFIVGILCSLLVAFLGGISLFDGEKAMLEGAKRVATPLVATIGFLFMSSVIENIGLPDLLSVWFDPVLSVAPIQTMFIVSALAGFVTQSKGASAAIVVPFLGIVLNTGVDPLTAAAAAAGPAALMQYFLTGGPVAALATAIPVVPGSELKPANKFQRPSILGGLAVLFVITLLMGIIL